MAGRSRAQRAGGEVGARGLIAQGGAGQEVHVGVQDEGERDDRTGQRFDIREPGVASEPFAPLILQISRAAQCGDREVAEDVARHRERQDEQPAEDP
jgi:hypothetical protein